MAIRPSQCGRPNERAGVRSVRALGPTESLKQVGQYKISFCSFTEVAAENQHLVSTAVPSDRPRNRVDILRLNAGLAANRNYECQP